MLFDIGATERLFHKHDILSWQYTRGVMETELARNFPVDILNAVAALKARGIYTSKTLGAGALTSLVAALDPRLAERVSQEKNSSENWGSYLADCQIHWPGVHCLARRLRNVGESLRYLLDKPSHGMVISPFEQLGILFS